MAESVKFKEEEMKQISNLQQSYMNIQSSLGQLAVNKIRLNKQLSDIGLTRAEIYGKVFDVTKIRESGW